jgi:hypothetical protein
VFSAVSLVGVDKAQAAVLSFNFHEETYGYNGFFKVDDSSLTGIGVEEVTVSEGRFFGFPLASYLFTTNYSDGYILGQRARAVFYQGAFRGLEAADANEGWRPKYYRSQLPAEFADYYGHYYGESSWHAVWEARARASWQITTRGSDDPSMWTSRISGYREHREETYWVKESSGVSTPTKVDEYRNELNSSEVYYTLVDTEPSPVPEPLTAGGTALALAGLSWLKHKKKMAA